MCKSSRQKLVFRTSLICALAFLTLTHFVPAQPSSPPWISVLTSKVKPEMRAEYEGYMKEISAAYKKGGAPFRAVYQNVAGDLSEYSSVTAVAKFADLDGTGLLTRVLGQENWNHLSRNINNCITGSYRTYAQTRDDLSIRGPMAEPSPFAIVSTILVAPGRLDDYENWIKNDLRPALQKGGVENWWVNRPIFGADLNSIVTVRWIKKLADIDAGPILTRAVGADAAAKINAKSASMLRSSSLEIIRLRPELSHLGQ